MSDARRDVPPKKVLGVLGSARRHGNSALLLDEVMRGLGGEFETETVFLADLEIWPCDACGACIETGACRVADDMQDVTDKLKAADAVVLASPVYMGGLTSRMRAFMERTWPLRKGAVAGTLGSYVVVGRRKTGAAVSNMQDYLARMGMVALPGVLGFALAAGEVSADEEARKEALTLSRALRSRLLGSRPAAASTETTTERHGE